MSNKHLNYNLKMHIVNLRNRNYKISDIAKIYNVTDRTIHNIILQYKNTKDVKRKKGTGKIFDNKRLELIKDIVKKNHNLSCKEISVMLLNEHQIKCSKWSVRRYLQKLGFSFKKP